MNLHDKDKREEYAKEGEVYTWLGMLKWNYH